MPNPVWEKNSLQFRSFALQSSIDLVYKLYPKAYNAEYYAESDASLVLSYLNGVDLGDLLSEHVKKVQERINYWFGPCAGWSQEDLRAIVKVLDNTYWGFYKRIRFVYKVGYGAEAAEATNTVYGYKITLYSPFWSIGNNKKSGTIVHEMTHLFGKTRDVGYVKESVEGTPADNPPQYEKDAVPLGNLTTEELMKNADTYAGFVEDYLYGRAPELSPNL